MIITLVAADFSVFAKYEKEQASPSDALEIDSSEKEASPNDAMMEQTIDISSEDGLCDITISGILPADVTASAKGVDVSGREEFENMNVICAYDITLYSRGVEYEPENGSVGVTIKGSDIERATEEGTDLSVYHIDNENKVTAAPVTGTDHDKIEFKAESFSVYAIVQCPENYSPDAVVAKDIADLTNDDAADGFYMSLFRDSNTYYVTGTVNSNNGALNEDTNITYAVIWFLEKVEGTDGDFYIYTEKNGKKYYIKDKNADNKLELSESKDTVFEFVQRSEGRFTIKSKDVTRYLQHSNSGKGIRFYTDAKSDENCGFIFTYANSFEMPDDTYGIDGKTYGLMYYVQGDAGESIMAKAKDANTLVAQPMVTRVDPLNPTETLYVARDTDITMWKFTSTSKDMYKLSTTVEGVTKYLKNTGSGVTLTTDESQATEYEFIPGIGANEGKFRLVANNKAVCYVEGAGFKISNDNAGDNKCYLRFAEKTDHEDDDVVVYSANKVSVSDDRVRNGAKIVVYTRVWNSKTKKYEFYAVDHDGSLVKCYESGDDIEWIGSNVNTLEWKFTEYYWEGTQNPNYYYEFQNTYSGQYLAPREENGQILSDVPIGVNLNGRRKGAYYSSIVAWDEPYYAYVGLKISEDGKRVVSCPYAEADDFYFAIIKVAPVEAEEVPTVDSKEYGITMKMIDYNGPTAKYENVDSTVKQNEVLGHTKFEESTGHPGLLSKEIDEATGYPKAVLTGKSLSELYDDATEVNHLFVESTLKGTGYFEYDSTQNYAYLNGNEFEVYKQLATTDGSSKPSLKHGQFFPYNELDTSKEASLNGLNLYDAAKKLLPESDPRKYEQLYLVQKPDYYFGMELEASFVQTANGMDSWGHDIVYEFTGDDDFWLYVDGQLVIDLGGIHSALSGSVNFRTGETVINGKNTTLYEIFKTNYKEKYPSATDAEVNKYLDSIFKTNDSGNKVFKDYTSHKMKIFYMERGAGASNLHMRFNLSSVKQGQITLNKKISGADQRDYDYTEFAYQIYYRLIEGAPFIRLKEDDPESVINVEYENSHVPVKYEERYSPPNSAVEYEDVYFISPGKPVNITVPTDTIEYYIVECGVNKEVYDEVKVNGSPITGVDADDKRADYPIAPARVSERPNVIYDNNVNEDSLRTLTVEKVLEDAAGNVITAEDDSQEFKYRLYLGDENQTILDERNAANMKDYFVRDPDGNYCKFNSATKTFESLGISSFSELSKPENAVLLRKATFTTSPNGAITRIKAGYKIEVRNLLVGSRFKIEEREDEIPDGYKLRTYDMGPGTFYPDIGVKNAGTIRANESPLVDVINKRGWGLNVNKVWTDASFTAYHDPIYVAVYTGSGADEKLIDGSVRKLGHPNTTSYWFFENLEDGTDFSDYHVYEVELTNPGVDSGGGITYDDINKIADGSVAKIYSRAKTSTVDKQHDYIVETEQGIPEGAANNVRTDTITNTRGSGIILKLADYSWDNLPKGTFTLKLGDIDVGDASYTSDENGLITIMYDFQPNVIYTLTQTGAPPGYIGLDEDLKIKVDEQNKVTIIHSNPDDYKLEELSEESLIAKLTVRNKQFKLKTLKVDSKTKNPLKDAEFALYRQVTSSNNKKVKDINPMSGYESLMSDGNGIVPSIDETIRPGTYYLQEVKPPDDYVGLEKDICFTIGDRGTVTIDSTEYADFLTVNDQNPGVIEYTITIPNDPDSEDIPITGIISDTNPYLVAMILMIIMILITIYGTRKKKRCVVRKR